MLAFDDALVAELLAEPLPKLTNRTLGARALEAELKTVREQGVARERDEAVLGESSLAAPITDHAGHAVGAIGVVAETSELLPRGPAKGAVTAVIEAARSISRELGAGRWPG
jgi:DNA-binding IclR family transcriptional regulator